VRILRIVTVVGVAAWRWPGNQVNSGTCMSGGVGGEESRGRCGLARGRVDRGASPRNGRDRFAAKIQLSGEDAREIDRELTARAASISACVQ
jgi:hypothetical protein